MVCECVRFFYLRNLFSVANEFSNLSQQVHNINRTNEPANHAVIFLCHIHIEIILTRRTMSKANNVETKSQARFREWRFSQC